MIRIGADDAVAKVFEMHLLAFCIVVQCHPWAGQNP